MGLVDGSVRIQFAASSHASKWMDSDLDLQEIILEDEK